MEASVQEERRFYSQAPSPLGGAEPGTANANTASTPDSTAAMLGLVVLFVTSSGAVWGWLLVQFVQLIVQPELTGLQERVAELSF